MVSIHTARVLVPFAPRVALLSRNCPRATTAAHVRLPFARAEWTVVAGVERLSLWLHNYTTMPPRAVSIHLSGFHVVVYYIRYTRFVANKTFNLIIVGNWWELLLADLFSELAWLGLAWSAISCPIKYGRRRRLLQRELRYRIDIKCNHQLDEQHWPWPRLSSALCDRYYSKNEFRAGFPHFPLQFSPRGALARCATGNQNREDLIIIPLLPLELEQEIVLI